MKTKSQCYNYPLINIKGSFFYSKPFYFVTLTMFFRSFKVIYLYYLVFLSCRQFAGIFTIIELQIGAKLIEKKVTVPDVDLTINPIFSLQCYIVF